MLVVTMGSSETQISVYHWVSEVTLLSVPQSCPWGNPMNDEKKIKKKKKIEDGSLSCSFKKRYIDILRLSFLLCLFIPRRASPFIYSHVQNGQKWGCNDENEGTKTSNWIVNHFSLTLFNLSLTWMLYFRLWLQNKGKILTWRKYYNQFNIYQRTRVSPP